jgi:Abortive infection alpha
MLVPLLEKASLAEEGELQRIWASLLANMARDADSVLPAFISILGELSPREVRILSAMAGGESDVTTMANNHHSMQDIVDIAGSVAELRLLINNLERLQLAIPGNNAQAYDGQPDSQVLVGIIRLTRFGASFILACSSKTV